MGGKMASARMVDSATPDPAESVGCPEVRRSDAEWSTPAVCTSSVYQNPPDTIQLGMRALSAPTRVADGFIRPRRWAGLRKQDIHRTDHPNVQVERLPLDARAARVRSARRLTAMIYLIPVKLPLPTPI